MKIGYYCESPVDRAAMAVFTKGILGETPEPINMDLEGHSVPKFFSALDGVFRGVHYNSDAEGLVIVVDCDNTPLHDPVHDTPGGSEDRCRFCQARKIITRARGQLKARQGRPELKVAIGLTVPAIEAWYLVGENRQVGEAAWHTGFAAGQPPVTTRQLKQQIYGEGRPSQEHHRPSVEHMTDCAVKKASQVIQDMDAIETLFPIGFGLMANEIRSWKTK